MYTGLFLNALMLSRQGTRYLRKKWFSTASLSWCLKDSLTSFFVVSLIFQLQTKILIKTIPTWLLIYCLWFRCWLYCRLLWFLLSFNHKEDWKSNNLKKSGEKHTMIWEHNQEWACSTVYSSAWDEPYLSLLSINSMNIHRYSYVVSCIQTFWCRFITDITCHWITSSWTRIIFLMSMQFHALHMSQYCSQIF